MSKKKGRNPKRLDFGNLLTWGVLGVAAYGGYRVYQATKVTPANGNKPPGLTDREKCQAAGGIWVTYPTFRYDPSNPAPGHCEMAGTGLRRVP